MANRVILCIGTKKGLFVAESAIVSVPLRVPLAVGANRMLTEQLDLAARLAPQLLVWLKSPLTVMPLIAIGIVELFDNVAIWAGLVIPIFWLPKLKLLGERVRLTIPVPLSVTTCGLPTALSVMMTAPVRPPMAVGVKVTLIVH